MGVGLFRCQCRRNGRPSIVAKRQPRWDLLLQKMGRGLMDYYNRLRCFDPGQWFMLPRDFLRICSEREAILLASLVNIATMRIKSEQDDEWWFEATTKQLRGYLPHLSKIQMEVALGKLEERGLITTNLRGKMRRRRWLYVRVSVIEKTLERQKSESNGKSHEGIKSDTLLGIESDTYRRSNTLRGITPSLRKNIPKKEHCSACAGTDWVDSYSLPLAEAIKPIKKVPKNSTPKMRASHFRKLHELDGFTPDEIKKVLDWYCTDLEINGDPNGRMIPVVWSGSAFRKKFTRLEDAMTRREVEKEKAQKKAGSFLQLKKKKTLKKGKKISKEELEELIDKW